jgi:tight adherence protein C
MRPTGLLLLSSLTICLAAWLVVSGWRQPRPRLNQAMRHLHRGGTRPSDDTSTQPSGIASRVGSIADGPYLQPVSDRWAQPLRLLGQTPEMHIGLLAIGGFIGLLVPALALALLQSLGMVSIGFFIPALLSLASAALVVLALHSDTMSRSAEVKVDLRYQLGAYLDMVTMLLAGNSGYEGALEQAARAGDGMLFRDLRRRMREVGTTGHSLVGALSLVASDYGIVELEQVAATATLSAAEGAPVARSLAAKCSTLRSTLAAEQEADARVRNDKVTPPLVGMALLFMALIIYPALNLN